MKKSNKFILPLGSSFVGLIIISLLFFSLFCGTGLYFLINGISESIELIVIGSILIVIASIVLIVFNYWILFQCRIEFERDCLVYHNILVRGTNRFPKSIYSFVGLLKIDNSINRIIIFNYINGEQNFLELKSFSKKQVSKIILEITSRAQSINENKIVVEIK